MQWNGIYNEIHWVSCQGWFICAQNKPYSTKPLVWEGFKIVFTKIVVSSKPEFQINPNQMKMNVKTAYFLLQSLNAQDQGRTTCVNSVKAKNARKTGSFVFIQRKIRTMKFLCSFGKRICEFIA